ncbi:MAG: hypothetical protein ACRYGF_13990 [Janthinobacterium lividum]
MNLISKYASRLNSGLKGGAISRSQFKTQLIIGFISFHIGALLLFAIPNNFPPAGSLRDLIAPYMRCLGMSDTWDTFAPNPKSSEQFLQAIVITKSGKYELYQFPRMERLSLRERYAKERYRKFVESVLCNECSGLWPDVEKAVARQRFDPTDPPVRVVLVKFESPIHPGTGSLGEDSAARPTVLSQLVVGPEDLQ